MNPYNFKPIAKGVWGGQVLEADVMRITSKGFSFGLAAVRSLGLNQTTRYVGLAYDEAAQAVQVQPTNNSADGFAVTFSDSGIAHGNNARVPKLLGQGDYVAQGNGIFVKAR